MGVLLALKLLDFNEKITKLNLEITKLNESGDKFNLIKKEYDELAQIEKNIEIKKAELVREKETVSRMLLVLEDEINKKTDIKITNWNKVFKETTSLNSVTALKGQTQLQ